MHWYLVSSFLFPLLKIAFFSKELMMLQQKVFCVKKLRTAQKKSLLTRTIFLLCANFLREIAPIDLYRLEIHWSILLLYFSEAGCENHKNCNEHFAFQSVLPTLPIVSKIIVGKVDQSQKFANFHRNFQNDASKFSIKIAKTGNTGYDQNNSRSLIFFIDPQRHCLWQIMT